MVEKTTEAETEVESVTKSKDGMVRRVCIRYFNAGDNEPSFTDRAARSIVRLFSIDDNYFIEDMAATERTVSKLLTKDDDKVEPLKIVRDESGEYRLAGNADNSYVRTCNCCCVGHCGLAHFPGAGVLSNAAVKLSNVVFEQSLPDPVLINPELNDLEEADVANNMLPFKPEDEILSLMTALNTKFELEDTDTFSHFT